jgi:2,5-diamino-6-(ribosylamino)-4(3H)-pyrimidinone 5'-phosphate reductase
MNSPSRPWVVISVTATADGRITLSRAERLLDEGPRRRWEGAFPADAGELLAERSKYIEERHRPTVVLEGSGTFVADEAGPLALPGAGLSTDELLRDFLPRGSPRWFAVVDGRGRVPWSHFGDDETRLLVVACRCTPLGYLAHLRREGVPYLIAGDERVDLAAALGKFRDVLGAGCVVSEGGGGLNGALLRAGLVDELHVVTIPALVGGLGTPSIVDGPPLPAGEVPIPLRLIATRAGPDGTIWTSYAVGDQAGMRRTGLMTSPA